MNSNNKLTIRPADGSALDSLNKVIEECVMGWNLPERVKRLSLGSYRYQLHDLDHLELVVAEIPGGEVVGVAAWEFASATDLPREKRGLLLHGLYVSPQHQHRGIGSRLVDTALEAVHTQGMDGLLVKAQADAVGFFQARGFTHLPVENPGREYAHRWWKSI